MNKEKIEEKAQEISNDEYAEILSYNIGHPLICDNCGAIIYDRDTTDAAFRAAIKMAQWKDEQLKEILKKKMNLFYPPIDDYNKGKLAVLKDLYQELFNEYYI